MTKPWFGIFAVLAGLVLAMTGCIDLKGGSVRSIEQGATTWPFIPATMRVSPFTSLGYDEAREAIVLDLMVELRDRVGDLTKGIGEFSIELREISASDEGQLLYAWTAELLTVEQNVQHYNPALNLYNLKLSLDRPIVAGTRLKVVVRFTDPGGKRLLAEGEIAAQDNVGDE